MAGNRKFKKSGTPPTGGGKANKASTPISPKSKEKPKKEAMKTKLLKEIIDLSSSCHESTIKIKEDQKRDTASEASSPDKYEDLKVAFNNIANMIVGYDPTVKFSMSPTGVPLIATNMQSPVISPKTGRDETNRIMAKFYQNVKESADKLKTPSRDHKRNTFEGYQANKSLFSKFQQGEDKDFYVNFQPLASTRYEGRTSAVNIPYWFPISYRPPPDMLIDDVDATLVAYIFMDDQDNIRGRELLIKSGSCIGDRNTLKTLMPKGWVDQEVINLLARRLSYIDKLLSNTLSMWFLPTMFAQYAVDWGQQSKSLIKFFQKDYMGKIDYVQKICVPINDEGVHWYLMIVDFDQQKLLLLDSLPCQQRNEYRRIKVQRLALILQEMLMHKSFYDMPVQYKHLISKFTLEEPMGIGHQLPGSNDCGVWVAQWMKGCSRNKDYNQISVRPATRMRLAIDLVVHEYNELKDRVFEKAFQHWLDIEERRKGLVRF